MQLFIHHIVLIDLTHTRAYIIGSDFCTDNIGAIWIIIITISYTHDLG